jgi:hypothetical protein
MKQKSFAGRGPKKVSIDWLIDYWNNMEGLPRITRATTRARIKENKWVKLLMKDLTREELTQIVCRYSEIRIDRADRFFDGFKKWGLLELFSRRKGEYIDKILETKWRRNFERTGKKERALPIGSSGFGGYEPKTKLE